MLPAPVLRVLTGYEMSCSVTGTPSIYTAIIRNSTTMVNVTGTATIVIKEEGNYTCVATNKYGTDVGEVSVIFTGKNNLYNVFITNTVMLCETVKKK